MTEPQRLINLTFHGVGAPGRALDPGEDTAWLSVERFSAALDAVAGRSDVRITFDDGNASDLELALPALQARGLDATFFVVAGRLGAPRFLSADDVRTLADAGMEIGCHGMRHQPWPGLDDPTLRQELVEARREIAAAAGRPVTTAACPFGAYGRSSLRALRREGYERVYTSDRGAARAGDWLQARSTIHESDVVATVLHPTSSSSATVMRRVKLTVKRWR